MPTDKRKRKREGRQYRQEQLRAAQRRAARRRRTIVGIVGGAVVLAVIAALSFSGGSGSDSAAAKKSAFRPRPCAGPPKSATPKRTFASPPEMSIDATKAYSATVCTDLGPFTVRLAAKKAPKSVNNFVFLARNHYYDGVTFHRVIPGFVVQGGDPEGTGTGGPGYTFEDELPAAGDYEVGSVAMANSGPNTNGSQFFVITGSQGVALPPNYSLFGQVTSGLDVVKAIEADGSAAGKPKKLHRMKTVTVKESA